MDDILKIAIGVFIGALAAAFAWEGIQTVRLEIAAQKMKQEIQQAQRRARDQEREKAKAQADFERERRAEQERLEGQRQATISAGRQAEQDREAAWGRFFNPSAPCVADPVTMPCANEAAKARKLFEIQYAAGILR